MNLRSILGLDDRRILAGGCCAVGKITEVKTCHWLKINTKPVRLNPLDGARFPSIIHFRYTVGGAVYSGKRYVRWNVRCPVKGEEIAVYYDGDDPRRYAVILSGAGIGACD